MGGVNRVVRPGCMYIGCDKKRECRRSSGAAVERTAVSLLGGMKESLSFGAFKRKQLRQERYPSQAHPPLGTGFLPLSRTAAFLFRSRDTFIPSPARPTSPPTAAAVAFTFSFASAPSFILSHLGIAHRSPSSSARTKKKYGPRNHRSCGVLLPIQISLTNTVLTSL